MTTWNVTICQNGATTVVQVPAVGQRQAMETAQAMFPLYRVQSAQRA